MSVSRPENWLENSPYNQPLDHSRRDLTLKRAASLARLVKKEKITREASEMKPRSVREVKDTSARQREEKDTKHRDDVKQSKEQRQQTNDNRQNSYANRQNSFNNRHQNHSYRHHSQENRQQSLDNRQHRVDQTSVTVVVPHAIRPPPENKPIYRGHVTVDTTKAKSNIDVVRMCIHELGWREIFAPRREPCDFYWHAISFFDHPDMMSGHVNKFPGIQELLSKVTLFRALDTMRNLFPTDYDFYPRSWFLPFQFHEFSNEVRQQQDKKIKPKPTYIVKPSEGSQGEGIYLLRDPAQYFSNNGRCHIVQEYLYDVFLLEKFKFDLRVYVTLTSVDPLEFHICKEGLARFSTIPYENPTNKNMHEVYMHLTNYSLNKRSSTFNQSDKDEEGSKRKLTTVFNQMKKLGYDTELLWEHIEHIVCKTLVAVIGELKIQHQTHLPPGKPAPRCFQILGFDIILMKDLKPMLLEVNANPSLSILGEQEVTPGVIECTPSIKDEEVKYPLVRDSLLLMAPQHKYTRKRRHRRRNHDNKHSSEHETAIVIKMDEMNVKETAIRITDPSMNVKETAIRIMDPSMNVKETAIRIMDPSMEVDNNDKKDVSDDKPSDDSDEKTGNESDDRGTDSENKMEEGSDEEELDDEDEDEGKEDEKNEEEVESCLKKIFPDIYGTQFHYLRLMERMGSLFTRSLGIRGSSRIGPTAFRMFARKCRLNRRGVTNATIDILYIDMQRKWEFMNPDRTSGLGFQGFVDSCFEISRRKFYLPNRREMLESFIDYCEEGLDEHRREEEAVRRRLARPLRKLPRRPVHLFQRSTITSLEEESIQELYDNSLARRNPSFIKQYDIHSFMSQKRKETYKPKPLQLYDSDDD